MPARRASLAAVLLLIGVAPFGVCQKTTQIEESLKELEAQADKLTKLEGADKEQKDRLKKLSDQLKTHVGVVRKTVKGLKPADDKCDCEKTLGWHRQALKRALTMNPDQALVVIKDVECFLRLQAEHATKNLNNATCRVDVSVRTKKGNEEVMGYYDVYYVDRGNWGKSKGTPFQQQSPTTEKLCPGCYVMWAVDPKDEDKETSPERPRNAKPCNVRSGAKNVFDLRTPDEVALP